MRGRYLLLLAVTGCADFAGIGDPTPLAPDAPRAPCNFAGIDLCLYASPENDLVLSADIVINTDRDCDLIYNKPLGRSACVVYARSITVNAKISARGVRPLILAASERIEVNGTIDLSGSVAVTGSLNVQTVVPAAANDATCGTPTVTAAGPGGSFGGKGGNGAGSVPSSAPPSVEMPEYLRGGCPGGADDSGGGFGQDGKGASPSGGALALVAGGSVEVTAAARVHANGSGGIGAYDPYVSATGGASGGMILIGAATVTIAGAVTANGGGGGEGVTGMMTLGNQGANGTFTTLPAAGGSGNPNAGDGGSGGAGTMRDGAPGMQQGSTAYSHGAGGGGAGFVIINGAELNRTGTISPEPIRLP